MSREANMRRWIALAAALYPRSWRAEYGKEFDALVGELKPGWRVFANIVAGGVRMRMTTASRWLALSVMVGLAGAIAGIGVSFAVAPHYVASAVISVTPQADPLRPVSPQASHQHAAAKLALLENEIMSRTSLAGIIEKLHLYQRDRQRMTIEDLTQRMRRDIRIQPRPSTTGVIAFSVSFDYPDPEFAQAVVIDLADNFRFSGLVAYRLHANVYLNFWRDKPAPPPPAEPVVSIVEYPRVPKRTNTSRAPFVAWGLAAGVLLGLLASLAIGRPRGIRRLIGFATAGGALAFAVSFALPVRYTSSATLIITPAILTQNPLGAPPAATSAPALLRQMETDVLSIQNLSKIIQDRRLDLYARERASRPIEEVVRTMLERDLRIVPVNATSGVAAPANALRISFSYRDKTQAQKTVQTVMSAIIDRRIEQERKDYLQESEMGREILFRKAGENLDILDPPSLPISPEAPNRQMIAAAGLGIGLLLGVIILCLRPPAAALRERVGADIPATPTPPDSPFFAIDFVRQA